MTYKRNSGSSGQDNKDMFLYIYATSRENARVTVKNPNNTESAITFNVRAGKQDSCLIPNNWAYIEDDKTISNFGVKVTSDKPIALYATNQHSSGKYDATNILPTTALMGEYVIQTYRIDQYSTEFALIATQNQSVTIKLRKTTIDIPEYETNGRVVVTSTQTETITLNMRAGQTYLYRSASDDGGNSANRATSLSGTTICSDYPLAVFIGGQSAKIPSDPENHIFSQAYPTDKWGKTFYVTPTYGMVYDYIQFTACKNSTQIFKNGTHIATINARESYIDTLKSVLNYASAADFINLNVSYTPNVARYTTSEVAECFLYGTSNTANHPSLEGSELTTTNTNYGAPVLTPIIPQELAMQSTMFATFTKTNTELKHYVNIVTLTAEKNGMRLDGANISGDFQPIPNTTYSYAIKEVSRGAHKLENVGGKVTSTFTARVYGMGSSSSSKESYAYAVGSRVSRKTDMLVNNQYIKEKTICVTQSLDFTGLIEGEYTSYNWNFHDYGGTTTGTGLNKTHRFSSAGDYGVELIVNRPYPYLCSGETGIYTDSVEDRVSVTIHVKDRYNANFHKKICNGETVTLQGRDENGAIQEYTYNSNYTGQKKFYTVDGCDSIVDIKIEVGYPESETYTQTACNSYTWHGQTYTESGTYTWNTKTEYNCDRTETLKLTILKPVPGPITDLTICANSTYPWNGQNITKAGTYTATLKAANGCDSIATLRVKVENEYLKEETVKRCYGESYTWRGKTLTIANTYTEHSPSPNGCDSTFILHLIFYPDYSNIRKTAETCGNKPYIFGNESLTKSGTYTKTFTSVGGCDSTVTLTLTVWPLEYDTIRENICAGERYLFGGKQLTTPGEYKTTETNTHGCTKTTVLYLTVNPHTTKYDTIRICEQALPFTYAGKYVATKAGDYSQKLDFKNQYGCDSIYKLHLIVDKTIVTPITISRCDYEGPYNHPDNRATKLQNLTATGTYRDTLTAVNGCDSILVLRLTVGQRTYSQLAVTECDNNLPWQDKNKPALFLYRDSTYNDTILNKQGCDSVVTVTFKVNKTYNVTVDTTICESEIPYNHPDKRFTTFRNLRSSQTLTQTVSSIQGCDSTVTLRLTVLPTTYNHQYVRLCEEALPYTYGDHGKQARTDGEYRDTLNTKNHYGCDSILVLHFTVLKTIIDRQQVVRCDNEVPYNHPDTRAAKLQNLTTTGTYRDTLTAVNGCDSIIELKLQVWKTFENDERQAICDYETFNFHGHVFKNMTAQTDPYRFDTILPTVHGCDSLVHLYLTVYPSYKIPTDSKTICQDKEHPNWEWRDDDGTLHGIVSIAEPRELFLADTMKTIHGCDSIFGIQLRIIPSYRFDSLYTLCQNERISWQGKSYCGDKASSQAGDRVLTPGLYRDTVKRQTAEGCDSIFYLQLRVDPTYDTNVNMIVCDNQDEHGFSLHDTRGTVIQDELPFAPSPSVEGVTKPTQFIDRDYMLKTIHGCDSAVHLHLTVYPTYEFVTQAKICGTEDYLWRGKMYYETGTYYDTLPTMNGCDSVYVLELYKKPMLLIPMFDTICDNETYQHVDTLWYTNGSHTLVETMVWTPGMPIPQTYSDVTFRSREDGCDSVVYRYWLHIKQTYTFAYTAAICSNESYTTKEHVFTGYEFEVEPGDPLQPYDTVFYDRYTAVNGCDSVYELNATIYPAYRHRDTITICDDGEATWRDKTYQGSMYGNTLGDGYPAGEHVLYDSLKTAIHNCDSIYELHLMVMPTYLIEENIAKCADEDMTWHGINMDHLEVGSHFFTDSLTTVTYGCDSVYHLYLTVNDTTREIRHDTICYPETYDFHGKPLTEAGYYYDTTLNEWNCHHFTHLYLEVIEPTVPTAWADSICADDDAYDLFYTYTGEYDPIAYSVKYDEEGHRNGFEDIINQPITSPDELSWLRIPMPNVKDDRTRYPKPNYYNIKLVLDNGICTNPDLCSTDTSIVLSYPSWITQQRFGDVIALYNDKYNGGYHWWAYQWYHGDELLVGETHEYLYVPTGLVVGDEYHVRLTRVGESVSFQTCPITIVADPVNNDFAPNMGYLAATPTCVCRCHPFINILSRRDGYYRISYNGVPVKEGVFRADVTEVELPIHVDGMYNIQLWSPDTPEEPYRSIKFLVLPQCPNYESIPF